MSDDEPHAVVDLWDLDAIRFREEDGEMEDWSFFCCQFAIVCFRSCTAGDDELRRRRDKRDWELLNAE